MRHHTAFFIITGILVLVFAGACAPLNSTGHTDERETATPHTIYPVDAHVQKDSLVLAYLEPFRLELDVYLQRVLTRSEQPITSGRPEGALENLVADIVRYRATAEMRRQIHVAVVDATHLVEPLPVGHVTVGALYRTYPADHHLVVMELAGTALIELADELAGLQAIAVSGLRYRRSASGARDVLVQSRSISADVHYLVVVDSELASNTQLLPSLQQADRRDDLVVGVRQALKEYLDLRESIAPYIDQRVR